MMGEVLQQLVAEIGPAYGLGTVGIGAQRRTRFPISDNVRVKEGAVTAPGVGRSG
jgi:hypothetical protein